MRCFVLSLVCCADNLSLDSFLPPTSFVDETPGKAEARLKIECCCWNRLKPGVGIMALRTVNRVEHQGCLMVLV